MDGRDVAAVPAEAPVPPALSGWSVCVRKEEDSVAVRWERKPNSSPASTPQPAVVGVAAVRGRTDFLCDHSYCPLLPFPVSAFPFPFSPPWCVSISIFSIFILITLFSFLFHAGFPFLALSRLPISAFQMRHIRISGRFCGKCHHNLLQLRRPYKGLWMWSVFCKGELWQNYILLNDEVQWPYDLSTDSTDNIFSCIRDIRSRA